MTTKQLAQSMSLDIPEHLLPFVEPFTLSKGTAVIANGEEALSVFLAVSGSFTVEHGTIFGSIYGFTQLRAGDFIGELEALSNLPVYIFKVFADTDATLIKMSNQVFEEWLSLSSELSQMLIKSLALKLITVAQTASQSPELSSYDKTIAFLLKYYQSAGTDHVRIDLTRQQIADKIGVNIRTVNRNIKRLSEMRCISVVKGRIVIEKSMLLLLEAQT